MTLDSHIAVKIPLRPTKAQEARLFQFAGCARWAYNWALARKKESYERTGEAPTAYDLQKEIVQLKRTDEFAWLREVPNDVPRRAIVNCDAAFKNFFLRLKNHKKLGFPKFKAKHKTPPAFSFAFDSSGYGIRARGVVLPRLGFISSSRRHIRLVEGRAIRATVRCENGRWWCSVLYVVPTKQFTPNDKPPVGIDLGIASFATLSTGEKIEAPKPLAKQLKRLKRLQRRLSASKQSSNRRVKKRLRVGRLHERIRNTRATFLHALTARLAKNHGHVVIEDLSVRSLMANSHLGRAISDLGWCEFRRQLEYKSRREGAVLIVADRWYPSSKACSCCGEVVSQLPLSVRTWTCEGCSAVHDRDLNAARNLVELAGNTGEVTHTEIGGQERVSSPVPVVEV